MYLKWTFAIYRLFLPNFVHVCVPLLYADLNLNEFKQIAFSALIENDRMLIMNAANTYPGRLCGWLAPSRPQDTDTCSVYK